MFRRILATLSSWRQRCADQIGQTTAEYALVIVGAAAIGALLLTWATKSDAIGKLFDIVLDQVEKLAK